MTGERSDRIITVLSALPFARFDLLVSGILCTAPFAVRIGSNVCAVHSVSVSAGRKDAYLDTYLRIVEKLTTFSHLPVFECNFCVFTNDLSMRMMNRCRVAAFDGFFLCGLFGGLKLCFPIQLISIEFWPLSIFCG